MNPPINLHLDMRGPTCLLQEFHCPDRTVHRVPRSQAIFASNDHVYCDNCRKRLWWDPNGWCNERRAYRIDEDPV